tara:strand:+ start:3256 stop:3519 length:264 start_codon:yes stop_codon:yes gene_type:complete
MAKEHIGDLVVDELIRRRGVVKGILRKEYKSVKPLRMEPMSDQEALYHYNQLTPEKMDALIQSQGRESVEKMISEMENLKGRNGNGR